MPEAIPVGVMPQLQTAEGVNVLDVLDIDEIEQQARPTENAAGSRGGRGVDDLPGGTTGNKKLDELLKMKNLPNSPEEMKNLSDEEKVIMRNQLMSLTSELAGQLSTVGQEMTRIKSAISAKGGLAGLTQDINKMQRESSSHLQRLNDQDDNPDIEKRLEGLRAARAARQDGEPDADSWIVKRKQPFSFYWWFEGFATFFFVIAMLFIFSKTFREASRQLIGHYFFGTPMDLEKMGLVAADSTSPVDIKTEL